jgi:caffeoyl-CoA O-methyltransferase
VEFLDKAIVDYCERFSAQESALLKKISRDTHANILMPRMLSGHLQGRLLSMISRMCRPETILEIGTYTGYSCLCLAEGLTERGKLITLDINEELESRVRHYFKESGLDDQIDYRIGDARKIIPGLDLIFDLVFIDADKESYSTYFDLVIDKVPSGGYILADNVLWSGKVLDPKPDKDTRSIMAFNQKVQNDERVENVMMPIRDGIMVMRRV